MITEELKVADEQGEEVVFEFKLEEAEGVVRMMVSAANAAGRRLGPGPMSYVTEVLKAQSEMIKKGLHVTGAEAPHLMLDIAAFHQKFGLEYVGKPRILEPELFDFRSKFIREEFEEWETEQEGLVEALTSDDGKPDHRRIAMGLHQQLDALVDLTYVVLGAAYLQFGPTIFHEAWKRVQAANMAKVRAETADQSKRGSTFDVVKPEGWMPPDHHDLVKDHAHIRYVHQGDLETNGANQ
jgi:predicted HAD superfamily Cof-like phosphohydrolase